MRQNLTAPSSDRAANGGGISVKDLSVRYQVGHAILEGLNIEIASNEILGLVGASGCGKSTFLKALAGLTAPTAGHISLAYRTRDSDRVSNHIAYVFQDATLLPWRNVFENVRLPLELKATRSGAANEKLSVAAALDSVGLDSSAWHKFPRQLSGGMRMRNSIARALVTDPDILLLDEPFAALDDMLRTRMNELILQLWQQRPRTILFVTHNIAEAIMMSHRVAVFGSRRIAKIIDNPLPWPRMSEQRTSRDFAEQYGIVSQALSEVAIT